MFPLATQLRFKCYMPGETLARLSGLGFTSSAIDSSALTETRSQFAATQSQGRLTKKQRGLPQKVGHFCHTLSAASTRTCCSP